MIHWICRNGPKQFMVRLPFLMAFILLIAGATMYVARSPADLICPVAKKVDPETTKHCLCEDAKAAVQTEMKSSAFELPLLFVAFDVSFGFAPAMVPIERVNTVLPLSVSLSVVGHPPNLA